MWRVVVGLVLQGSMGSVKYAAYSMRSVNSMRSVKYEV